MIFDTDDLYPGNDRLDLLQALKDANPLFRLTAFAVPGLGSDAYWDSLPEWIELAMHGWTHSYLECENWTADRMREAIAAKPDRFVSVFKAPYWRISDGCYAALAEAGWAVADQHLEDDRRPRGLRTYFYEDSPDRHHGHIQNVCGNGLEETFTVLLQKVKWAETFELVSEMVAPW